MMESVRTTRVLIVEDKVLDEIKRFLHESTHDLLLDGAASRDRALELIAERARSGVVWDMAVIDFKIPRSPGAIPETDFSVCELLQSLGVPVVHITSFSGQDEIREHLTDCHAEEDLLLPRYSNIDKDVPGEWITQLAAVVKKSQQRLVNKRVRVGIAAVLDPSADTVYRRQLGGFRAPSDSNPSGCGTHDLIQLHDYIVEGWPLLFDEVKKVVKQYFAVVDLDGDNKRLELFQRPNT